MRLFLLLFLLFFSSVGYSQSLKGIISDAVTSQPLHNCQIIIGNQTVLSDSLGYWESNIETGKYSITFKMLGYHDFNVYELDILSGKQKEFNVALIENINLLDEVKVIASKNIISAFRVNTETLTNIPGNGNDPVRMLTYLPGISNSADDKNDLIVRGNSSIGILWRIEGIEVINPNHYTSSGGTGGVISSLNLELIGNSNFYLGAFPADFGNVYSGVFDINFRNGNKNKTETSFDLSNLDLNFTIEGPIQKQKSSYIVGIRHSTIPIFNAINENYTDLLGAPQL